MTASTIHNEQNGACQRLSGRQRSATVPACTQCHVFVQLTRVIAVREYFYGRRGSDSASGRAQNLGEAPVADA